MTQLILPDNVAQKRTLIRNIIRENDSGKQFTVVNVKADGTLREYRAMTNVQAGLKGGESTTAHKVNLMTVFDTVANEYRAVNLDTVLFLDFGAGASFIFTDVSTAQKIKDKSVSVPLQTAAQIAATALNVIKKSLDI